MESIYAVVNSEMPIIWPTIITWITNIQNSTNNTYDFSLYNSFGQELERGLSVKQIDLSVQQSGLYLLKIVSKYRKSIQKIIKR